MFNNSDKIELLPEYSYQTHNTKLQQSLTKHWILNKNLYQSQEKQMRLSIQFSATLSERVGIK